MVTNTPEDKQLAEVFKEELNDVGITMDIELIEFATQLDRALKEDFDLNKSSIDAFFASFHGFISHIGLILILVVNYLAVLIYK